MIHGDIEADRLALAKQGQAAVLDTSNSIYIVRDKIDYSASVISAIDRLITAKSVP